MTRITAPTRAAARRQVPPGWIVTQDGQGGWLAFPTWSEYAAFHQQRLRAARPPPPDRGPLVKLSVWVPAEVRTAVQSLRRRGESGGDVIAAAVAQFRRRRE